MTDRERDLNCACLEDGEVRNGAKYFENRSAAELYCADLKASYDPKHMSADELAECDGRLDVMEKYGDDACHLFGYTSGGGYDSGGYDDYEGYEGYTDEDHDH